MRLSEEVPRVYYIWACYACGEHLDTQGAKDDPDVVLSPYGLWHRHRLPDGSGTTLVGAKAVELVEHNEFTRVKGERDLLRANEASLRSRTERAELQAADWRHTAVTLERLVAQGVRGALRRWLRGLR
jgi:hypothetical protein